MGNLNDREVLVIDRMYQFDDDRLNRSTKYMAENWQYSFFYAFVYVILIFTLQNFMKNKMRLELQTPLALWSGILAVFSTFGALRTVPELISVVREHGLQHSVCDSSAYGGITGLWVYLFAISKLYELGDTVFIVLRKQKLIFLHWYHHITVMIYCWYSYPDHTAPARWFVSMNYSIHAIMYTYYTAKALKIALPRQISALITMLQLTQMIIGCALNVWSYHLKNQGELCQQSYENIKYSVLMYLSYFILFVHFFYTSYIRKAELRKVIPKQECHKE